MLGVPRELIEHKLHLDLKAKPIKQRLHHFTQDKKDVIKRDIARLSDAGFIKEVYHPDWLANTFDNMRKFKMKLNPEKCTFGVPSEKLLRYMVSRRGIDPNLEKVSGIAKMKPPESLHDVQKLMGVYGCLEQIHLMTRCQGAPFI
jgi:hypothetical protein